MRLRAKQASEIAFNSIRKQINHRSSFAEWAKRFIFGCTKSKIEAEINFLPLRGRARCMMSIDWRHVGLKRIAHWLMAPPESISVPLNMNCSLFPFLACTIKAANRKTKLRLSTVPLTSWIARPSSPDKNKTSSDPNSTTEKITDVDWINLRWKCVRTNYSRHQFVSWDSTMSMKHPPWWWEMATERGDGSLRRKANHNKLIKFVTVGACYKESQRRRLRRLLLDS